MIRFVRCCRSTLGCGLAILATLFIQSAAAAQQIDLPQAVPTSAQRTVTTPLPEQVEPIQAALDSQEPARNLKSEPGPSALAAERAATAPPHEPLERPAALRRAAGPDRSGSPSKETAETAQAVRIVVGMTVLAILPALLVCLTAFMRTIIVLSMLRHAIGMPETPPNTVLIGLALFLTLFTMSPVLNSLNEQAFQPFMAGKAGLESTYQKASAPLREFMVRQTREQDLALMVELSKAKRPESMADVSNVQLIPAFMLSELRAAFQIGFVIFLPFLLIDLIVSSVLMALGMMMMPPTTVALPLKLLMFILVDGWSVVLKALVGSFH
ncbi:MAG TPA: flagellar type III secretion system pore protein FliP [Ramlibacter sp.]|nr:flagellar type III secretion system pore protein FliP [Ramlibacter sp.]